jgi:protein TonB
MGAASLSLPVWSGAAWPFQREAHRNRVRSAAGVAAVHLLLGYAFVAGLGYRPAYLAEEPMKLFDVVPEPVAPPEPRPAPEPRADAPDGAPAPPNLRATPKPIAAPTPRIRIEVAEALGAAPVAGVGSDTSAGAAPVIGPGTGSGGVGTGSGAGGEGTGGGGLATPARRLGGRIDDDDYPTSAYRARIGGTVVARLTVSPAGRVSDCRVTQSSGHAELDSTTCRLILRRFRYAPARDTAGRPVESEVGWRQRWWLEGRR